MLLEKAKQAANNVDRAALGEQSLQMARSLRYDGGIIRASLLLGDVKARLGQTEEALQHLLEAEAKVQAGGNNIMLLGIYKALGDLFYKEKLYAGARRYYARILIVEPGQTEVQEKMADAYLAELLADSAETIYKRLIVHFREQGDIPGLVKIYQKIAGAYDQQGNAGKSLYYYIPIEDLVERYGSTENRSVLYNNLGRQYAALRDYQKALEYFKKAELQCKFIPCDYPDVLYANMGIALHNLGDSRQGIEYLLKAQAILQQRQDKVALANLEHLLAGVYFSANDLYNALTHNEIAIRNAKETNQSIVLAEAYKTAADVYQELYDFEKAFVYFRQYLVLIDSVRLEDRAREQRFNQQRTLLAAAEGQIKYLIARQNFKDLELAQIRYEAERLELLNKNLELETRRKEDELLLLQKQTEVDQAKIREQTLQALRARQELRLAAQNLDTEKKNHLIRELQKQEEIDRAEYYADSLSRSKELEILRRDKDIAGLQLRQQATFRRSVYALGALLLVILGLLGAGWLFARRTNNRLNKQNQRIQAQNKEIEEERHKSDQLLLNILPEEIATELKTRGYATPRYFESATVVFTDFVNFTKLSSQLTPEQLIDELNSCFLAFDEICEKYGLEKIKTIGDAFMCAGGLPVPSDDHPVRAVAAALEMNAWLKNRNAVNPQAIFKEMRIGIHTGPVVAGVIGKNKFAFDIWGDAVNLAARLEEQGEPFKVNISATTAEAVKHRYALQFRGSREVHNKGAVDMYFIKGNLNASES